MGVFAIILNILFVFISSLVVTELVRRYSIKNNVIDIPNHRSSHERPTPRGGGVVISLSIIVGIINAFYMGLIPYSIFISLLVSVLIISIAGWLDDHKDLAFYWRMLFYSIACIWSMLWTGSLDAIKVGTYSLQLSPFIGTVITFLGLIWLTNLYNFMDGSDGIAAIQAICAGIFAGSILFVEGQTGLAMVCFFVASSSLGFLYWNWSPAKIFMGDIGSCVLGFVFGALAVISDLLGVLSVYIWCILLSVFICDATFTLFKRMFQGEKWYKAHREHAYQKLIQMGMSHRLLAIVFLIFNLCVIWPIAFIGYVLPEFSVYLSTGIVILIFLLWTLVQVKFDDYQENENKKVLNV